MFSKSNTVVSYNETKCSVNSLDQMCKAYSVKSGVRRWPLACFFNMLDLAGINAFILYKKVTGQRLSRRQFLKMLVENLITCARQRQPSLSTFSPKVNNKRKTCGSCTNKTADICSFCLRPTSEKCVKLKCTKCLI